MRQCRGRHQGGKLLALMPGCKPEAAIAALQDSLSRFEAAMYASNPTERYSGYVLAAAESQKVLSNAYGQDAIETLVLGPTFHAFAGANLLAFGSSTVARLDHELRYRIDLLTSERELVKQQVAMWSYEAPSDTFASKRFHALVLDTGVLEEHSSVGALASRAPDWLSSAGQAVGGIRLAVAAVSLEEIDRHKSTGNQKMHGTETLLKTAARSAQKVLAALYEQGPKVPLIDDGRHPIFLTFQQRALDHVPLPISDNEVIAFALELEPFAASVTFVSYDLGPCITARQQGLSALQLQY